MKLAEFMFLLWIVQSITGSSSTGSTGSTSTGSTGPTSTGSTVSTSTGSTSTGSTASTSTGSTGSTSTVSTVSTSTGSTSTGSTGSTSTGSTGSTTTGSTVSTSTGSTSTGSTPSTSTGSTGSTSTGSTVSTSTGSTSTGSTASTSTGSTGSTSTGSIVSTSTGSTSTGSTPSTSTGSTGSTSTTSSGVIITTTAQPRPHCEQVDPPVRLRSNGAAPCIVHRFNKHSIQYRSPEFPEQYPNEVECEATTSSIAPRVLEVTLTLFKVHEHDRLVIKGPFHNKRRLTESDLDTPIILPSAHWKFYFKSNEKKRMKGFKLKVISKNLKSCQRTCKFQKGDKGFIKHGPYGSDTFCEWWMEAPAGCFIKLSFVKFDVGPAGSGDAWGCDGDYVGVDRDGDPTYAHPNSRTFCGPTPPEGIRSVANKMNLLFNGRQGGFNGFRAKYEVVCR